MRFRHSLNKMKTGMKNTWWYPGEKTVEKDNWRAE